MLQVIAKSPKLHLSNNRRKAQKLSNLSKMFHNREDVVSLPKAKKDQGQDSQRQESRTVLAGVE